MTFEQDKAKRIADLEDEKQFLLNHSETEKYIVRELLNTFSIPFKEEELKKGKGSSDVNFRGDSFQLKEVLDPGRERDREYSEALRKARRARTSKEFPNPSFPREKISVEDIVAECVQRERKYGCIYPRSSREKLILICYFNFVNHGEVCPAGCNSINEDLIPDEKHFRSLCIVSTNFVIVVYAEDGTPKFLKASAGKILEKRLFSGDECSTP